MWHGLSAIQLGYRLCSWGALAFYLERKFLGPLSAPSSLSCCTKIRDRNDSVKRKSMNNVNPYLFRLVGLLTIVALILSIVGQTNNTSSLQDLTHVDDKTKIGIVIFLVSWVGLCFLFFLVSLRLRSIEEGERRLLMAVGISIPLLLVRLVYSFLVVFANNPDFSTVTGNVTVMLVLSVIEEILIVYICLLVGLTLSVRPNVDNEAVATGYASDYTPVTQPPEIQQGYTAPPPPKEPRRQRRQRRGGPIHQLIGLAVDEIAAARQR
jgi:hypothetical protein